MRCPACGLELPAHARFCARCGAALPGAPAAPPAPAGQGYPAWLVVLFWAGALLTLLVALVYATVLVAPDVTAPPGLDPAQLRTSALVAALAASGLFAVQAVAAVGLTRGKAWARTPATLACVGWALTCVGLPVAALVLARLWRR